MIDVDGANLISEALAGDDNSFMLLVTAYASRVRNYVAARLSGNEDVDDVTQDTWTAVWNQLALYDERRGSVDGWLYWIAGNKAADCRRARARDEARCTRAEGARLPQAAPAVADWEVHEAFAERIARLPSAQRETLTLRFELDLSRTVTASALHRSPHAIQMREERALASLGARLGAVRPIDR